jgi:predicted AlkP superfamily phosphohydrolase/phosphomutase
MKLLIVGFDALDYEIFRCHNEVADLTILPFRVEIASTGPSWTSIYTGLSSKNHKITDHWGRHTETSLSFDTTPVRSYIWDVLNQNGFSVELFNLPITYPPKAVYKYMLSGIWIPEGANYVYPRKCQKIFSEDLYKSLDLIYRAPNRQKWVHVIKTPIKELVSNCIRDSKVCVDNFLRLHNDSNFGFIQFSFVDRIGHVMCGFDKKDTEDYVYCAVNEVLNYLLPKVSYENLIIVSDHGYSRKHSGSHFRNKIGTFSYKGQDFKKAEGIKIRNIDFCPTVLHLFGITKFSINPPFDGKSLFKHLRKL